MDFLREARREKPEACLGSRMMHVVPRTVSKTFLKAPSHSCWYSCTGLQTLIQPYHPSDWGRQDQERWVNCPSHTASGDTGRSSGGQTWFTARYAHPHDQKDTAKSQGEMKPGLWNRVTWTASSGGSERARFLRVRPQREQKRKTNKPGLQWK